MLAGEYIYIKIFVYKRGRESTKRRESCGVCEKKRGRSVWLDFQ